MTTESHQGSGREPRHAPRVTATPPLGGDWPEWWKGVRRPLGAVLGLAFLVVAFVLWHADLQALSRQFVDNYGLPALFLLTVFADSTVQPIPPDVFVFGSGFGGAHPVSAAVVAGLASALGGVCGYYIGQWIGPWRMRRWVGSKVFWTGRNLYKRYDWQIILIAATTPLPYSAACWIAGIYRASPVMVFFVSLISRIPRYMLVGYLGSVV